MYVQQAAIACIVLDGEVERRERVHRPLVVRQPSQYEICVRTSIVQTYLYRTMYV